MEFCCANLERHGEFELQGIRVVGFLSATEPSFNELRQTFSVLLPGPERVVAATVLPGSQHDADTQQCLSGFLGALLQDTCDSAKFPLHLGGCGLRIVARSKVPAPGPVGRIVSDVQPESSNGACGLMPKDIATWKNSSVLPRAVSQSWCSPSVARSCRGSP